MNKVILSGNLCRDIELKKTQGGNDVVTNCLAVQRDFKTNGNYESDFINIVVWGASANYLSRTASKGDRVELVGRWQVRKYEDSNGTQQNVSECVVENIRVFAKPKETQAAQETFDEDLPF